MANKAHFIIRYRQAATKLINVLDELGDLKKQYDALNYTNAQSGLLAADFGTGDQADITVSDFNSAIGAVTELNASFTSGGTVSTGVDKKIYKLRQFQ